MKKPYLIAGIAFGMGSLWQILIGNYFAASATGLFAAGLLLAGTVYLPTLATVAAGSLRDWHNLLAMLLAMLMVASSIYLFGYDIGRDLYKSTHSSTTKASAQ
ncbi:hypothetical protein [Hymenobacter sp. IS2118]|uniref:hypothetical protein n=1 Tax=Hymenobacter sp. IS2118 TaxID=1505605 RepID=UPI00054E2EEB|nr:hypothetical protein [Hymenobacter sp. IS2118]